MRVFASGLFAAFAAVASAQNPDVTIKLDLRLNYRTPVEGSTTQRLYDTFGRPSVLQLGFKLEPGIQAIVAQRFQRIANDGDPDVLDLYYIEDVGVWRLGKQPLPFGIGTFLNDRANAARGDVDLPFEGGTLSVAAVDAGPRRPRGVVGRAAVLGGRLGVSAAFGSNFGVSAASFTLYRRPEESYGQGGGYRRIYGVDASRVWGNLALRGEYIRLEGAEKGSEPTGDAFDLSLAATPSPGRTFLAGITQSPNNGIFYRLQGDLRINRNASLEPLVRFRNGESFDFAVALRLRF